MDIEVKVTNNSIEFKSERKNKVSVSFQRTIRIPDDGKNYPLPPSLGNFKLYRVEDYTDKVPGKWIDQGVQAFFCMYQREAMWLNFSHNGNSPNAIRIGVGMINAIDGEEFKEGFKKGRQDYMVLPDQPWLDGIATGEKTIKQFVAMKADSGYSIEYQITGGDTFGGIQILVYDAKKGIQLPKRQRWDYDPNPAEQVLFAVQNGNDLFKDYWFYTSKTQRCLHCMICSCISFVVLVLLTSIIIMCLIFPIPMIFLCCCCYCFCFCSSYCYGYWSSRRMSKFSSLQNYDIILQEQCCEKRSTSSEQASEMTIAAGGRMKQKIIRDKYGQSSWDTTTEPGKLYIQLVNPAMIQEITGEKAPDPVVDAKTYASYGFPWFDYYEEDQVEGVGDSGGVLNSLKSVKEIDEEKDTPEDERDDNESVEVGSDTIIKI